MIAFVTGGTGFVGGWLGRHLQRCGDDVVIADEDLDITDGPAVVKAVEEAAPDAVYHLAALTHVGESWEAPDDEPWLHPYFWAVYTLAGDDRTGVGR